ncbi:MAG: hypothetical protein EOP92_07405 [Lysobacteraceae bacterium]|nr:MAG: hypothetical protein EOP92_07405 [Xanthomonadaceae bacterium]
MSRLRPLHLLALALLLSACSTAPVAPQATPRLPDQVSNAVWEQDMQRFAAEDALAMPAPGGVVFVGSSSIRMWDTLAKDFPGVPVINRGFGGSEIRDSTWYAGRIIVPYAPRQVLVYAGDNDLFSGRTPLQLRDDFRAFVSRVRRDLPDARIAYIANKPSPSRANLLAAQREANALLQSEAVRLKVDFIDIFTPMLDARGKPREDLFIEDRLHMNAKGYAIWREVIAPYLTAR